MQTIRIKSTAQGQGWCQRFTILGLALCGWLISLSPCAGQTTVHGWSGQTMGPIEYNVKFVGPPNCDLESVKREVTLELETLNQQMSTYLPDSEVTRFNQSTSTEWFPVSPATARVVMRALEISRRTEGAFDITVKPVVERWNFGANKQDFVLPNAAETSELLARIGYQKLEARLEPAALRKQIPTLQIDLSAIAKGYAVDLAAERLMALGFAQHFVEIGGEVRAAGRKPDGAPWRVGIEKPIAGVRTVERVVDLDRGALATSGDYRNFMVIGDQRFSHTIDPRTAQPVVNQMASASVIAPDCMTADAYATALMVRGPQLAADVLQQEQLGVFVLERVGEDFRATTLGNFPTGKEAAAAGTGTPLFTLLISFLVFGTCILAMAVGAIFSKRTIKGSCGGISATTGADGSLQCSLCEKPVMDCPEKKSDGASSR